MKLEVHICDQRRSYFVEFATEDQVMAFIERRTEQDAGHREEVGYGNHAYFEVESAPIPEGWLRLEAYLYPLCDHGMLASNCFGPAHYASDEEIAKGW